MNISYNWKPEKTMTGVPDSGRAHKIPVLSRFEGWCRKHLSFKEIGWWDIGEVFFRYQLFRSKWCNVYLHQLDAPNWHPTGCHDHPWSFVTILLKSGYLEHTEGEYTRRYPGMILYRRAEHLHDVITPYGRSWSLVITGPKRRDWGFATCEE